MVRVENITASMEIFGQKLEYENGKVVIKNSKDAANSISKQDESFIIEAFEKAVNDQNFSNEKKEKDITDAIEKNPGRSKYRIVYSENHWIEVRLKNVKVDEISTDEVNPYGYTEQLMESVYPAYTGKYYNIYEMIEKNAVSISKNSISQYATFTTGWTKTTISDVRNGQASGGVIMIQNSGKYINRSETTSNSAPCEVESQVVFSISGSVGVTLYGVFNMSVTTGVNWTQYAIIRTDLKVVRKYGAYYM